MSEVYLRCEGPAGRVPLVELELSDFCLLSANSTAGQQVQPSDKMLNTKKSLLVGVSVGSLLLLCLILTLCSLLYLYNKDTIKIWLYSQPWSRVLFSEDLIDSDKPYDAFLSYAQADSEFVEKDLLAGLESPEDGSEKYKCLIHTRDWNAGQMIPDQIMHSVESSRRTIIVLSKPYIQSMWTKLEFRAAHTQALQDKTQRVIIIVKGELPKVEEMEEDLQKYISLNTYLHADDPWFWQKLR